MTVDDRTADQVVKIEFHHGGTHIFTLDVNTSQTVDQLIQQVQAKRLVFIFYYFLKTYILHT